MAYFGRFFAPYLCLHGGETFKQKQIRLRSEAHLGRCLARYLRLSAGKILAFFYIGFSFENRSKYDINAISHLGRFLAPDQALSMRRSEVLALPVAIIVDVNTQRARYEN
jgi:hypothetical protein